MYLFYYLQVMSVSLQHLVNWVFYLFITNIQKTFSVRKGPNIEHFLLIHGKSVLYQYQSLTILSQSMGVNAKVLLVIWLFWVPSYKTLSTEKEEKCLFLSIFLI